MANVKITGESTMQEVLDAYPSAQRSLFKKYHIGGCSSCGYQPGDSLKSVADSHDIKDVNEIVTFLETSADEDAKLQISVKEVAEAMKADGAPKLLDVRTPDEFEAASIFGSELFTREVNEQMADWDKNMKIVFICHTGNRSMDAASFFAGHGFVNAKTMTGGIDAWSQEIDKSVPRYQIAAGPERGKAVIKPLNESFAN